MVGMRTSTRRPMVKGVWIEDQNRAERAATTPRTNKAILTDHQRAEVESSLKLYAEYINAHTNTMKAKPLDRDEPFHRFRPSHGYSTTSDVTSALHEVAKLINKLGKDALFMSKWLSRRYDEENVHPAFSSTPNDKRTKSYEPFPSKDKAFVNKPPKILYVSSNIISEGLTITGATCSILLELVPMNKQFEQLVKRIHRYGQDVETDVYQLKSDTPVYTPVYKRIARLTLLEGRYGIRYKVCGGHPPYLAPEHYYINRLPNRERKRYCDTSHLEKSGAHTEATEATNAHEFNSTWGGGKKPKVTYRDPCHIYVEFTYKWRYFVWIAALGVNTEWKDEDKNRDLDKDHVKNLKQEFQVVIRRWDVSTRMKATMEFNDFEQAIRTFVENDNTNGANANLEAYKEALRGSRCAAGANFYGQNGWRGNESDCYEQTVPNGTIVVVAY
ncbi:hypothetical protein DTO217A2_5069 [Paecilomyces variotii]|nr:hypothetical protein DTO217A2_5069 [Paecilomyces variotii]